MRWFISGRVDPSGIGCRRLDECLLLGEEQKTFAQPELSAFDPTETLAVHYGNVLDVGFSPIKVRQDIDNHQASRFSKSPNDVVAANSCRTGLDRRPAGCGQNRPCWIDPGFRP